MLTWAPGGPASLGALWLRPAAPVPPLLPYRCGTSLLSALTSEPTGLEHPVWGGNTAGKQTLAGGGGPLCCAQPAATIEATPGWASSVCPRGLYPMSQTSGPGPGRAGCGASRAPIVAAHRQGQGGWHAGELFCVSSGTLLRWVCVCPCGSGQSSLRSCRPGVRPPRAGARGSVAPEHLASLEPRQPGREEARSMEPQLDWVDLPSRAHTGPGLLPEWALPSMLRPGPHGACWAAPPLPACSLRGDPRGEHRVESSGNWILPLAFPVSTRQLTAALLRGAGCSL